MRIDVYEILTTNSLSGSRIIINDNFKMLADGLNSLYSNIGIDDDGKMSLNNIKTLNCETASITNANIRNFSNGINVCMKIDENGHLLLLDENGQLTLDVNTLLTSCLLKNKVDANIETNQSNGTVEHEYVG